jgi:D-lactate dehydrogenase
MQKIASDDSYYQYKNIIVVPHNAFNTVEGDERSYKLVVSNVLAFLKGKPQNVVIT